VVATLIAADADPETVTKWGETSLHKAARNGHFAVVKILLEVGANVNTADTVSRAAAISHVDVVLAVLLVVLGDVSTVDVIVWPQ
jgi:ankyrin repeat protein